MPLLSSIFTTVVEQMARLLALGSWFGNHMENFPLRLCTWGSSWQIFLPCVIGEATFTRNRLRNSRCTQPIRAYMCMPLMYILSDNLYSWMGCSRRPGRSRRPLSEPPYQQRSQRACHTAVSNALKWQRVVDIPCPIARSTTEWCHFHANLKYEQWHDCEVVHDLDKLAI